MSEALRHLATPGTSGQVPYSRPSTPAVPLRIGFVGLGAMGYIMSRNLATKRPNAITPILVWNRTQSKAEKLLEEQGPDRIRIAQSPSQVALESDIIFTNLANDAVVSDIFKQFATALKESPPSKTRIFVETSTIYPHLAGELDSLITSIPHCHLVTAPVFGTPAVADKSQLLIVMSGDYHSKQEVAYQLVPSVGRKVIDLGGNIEKAPTLKLIGNSMILGTIEIMAEAYTLAEKSGIGADGVQNVIKEVFPAPGMLAYSDRMAHDKFDGSTGFAIDGGIKDASHIRRLTAEHNSPMPVIDIAHQHLITARAIHAAQKLEGKECVEILDWSGIIAGTRAAAGLDAFDMGKHTNLVREE